jgi:predicted DsbA family dithiol-disulfide isomerase
MKVEIWSDVVCPWCYIGKRRFETALAGFDQADEVDVVWRSFQLNPAHPRGVHERHGDHLAAKLGRTLDEVRELTANVTALAAAEGLEYHFEMYTVVNTIDAHRLTHLAKAQGLGSELHERLFRAQLVEGEVLDDADTLVRLAVEVGVPKEDARRVLESDECASDVAADIDEARALGATGVPFFVVDRRYGVSGAQSSDVFLQVLERARDDAVPASEAR